MVSPWTRTSCSAALRQHARAPGWPAGLGVDLPLLSHWIDRMRQLGYRVSSVAALTWPLCRLALWRGDPDLPASPPRTSGFRSGSPPLCRHPGRGLHPRHPRVQRPAPRRPRPLAARFERACLARLYALHVLLFNIGQISEAPIYGLRRTEKWRDQLTPAGTPRRDRGPGRALAGAAAAEHRPFRLGARSPGRLPLPHHLAGRRAPRDHQPRSAPPHPPRGLPARLRTSTSTRATASP